MWTFTWFIHFELPFSLKGTEKMHTEGLSKFHSNIYIPFSLGFTQHNNNGQADMMYPTVIISLSDMKQTVAWPQSTCMVHTDIHALGEELP